MSILWTAEIDVTKLHTQVKDSSCPDASHIQIISIFFGGLKIKRTRTRGDKQNAESAQLSIGSTSWRQQGSGVRGREAKKKSFKKKKGKRFLLPPLVAFCCASTGSIVARKTVASGAHEWLLQIIPLLRCQSSVSPPSGAKYIFPAFMEHTHKSANDVNRGYCAATFCPQENFNYRFTWFWGFV